MIISQKLIPFLCFFILMVMFEACSKKHFICPAYNSYFIHDQEIRESRFSPFIIDSLSNLSSPQAAVYGQDSASVDNNSMSSEPMTNNSKFQPKEKLPKKVLHNGLLTANSNKHKTNRGVEDIEMKIIMVKPLYKYSNIDSSSINKTNKSQDIPNDTL